jgi:hypothetical protein
MSDCGGIPSILNNQGGFVTRIYVTSVINAPVEKVWAAIRDFNALPNWHPFVESSKIEQGLPSATVGCVRSFQLKNNGGSIREQLLALSDRDRSCTYSILESPMGVRNYVATLRLIEITESKATLGEWQADFAISAEVEKQIVETLTSVFREGFKSLQDKLAK